MSHRIEPGQEYAHCAAWPDDIRIRVVNAPTPDYWGRPKAKIVTLTADGRELRPRRIDASQLHATGTVGTEELPRRTGYRLVRNADGSDVR